MSSKEGYLLSIKERELENLQKNHNELKIKFSNLEKEYADLKATYYLSQKSEKAMKIMQETIEALEKELTKTRNESYQKEDDLKYQVKEQKIKFDKEMSMNNNLYENMTNKVETVHAIQRLSEKQQVRILELEDELVKFKDTAELDSKQKDLKNDMKFTELKKKMMFHIKETQKNVAETNFKQMDLSTKLTLLQNHQLLVELEYQSNQIEELLKKKIVSEKKIFELSNDLQVSREVQKLLEEKNKKYMDMVKNLSKEKEKNVSKQEELPEINKSTLKSDRDNDALNSYLEKKIKKLELQLKKKETEYNIIKLNYDSLFNKLNKYEKKIYSIYQLFQTGLQKVCEDDELKNKKEIYINVHNIKNDDFSQLTNEQKYSVLMIFLKHILPLINLEELNNPDFGTNINNVKMKFHVKHSSKYSNYNSIENHESSPNTISSNTFNRMRSPPTNRSNLNLREEAHTKYSLKDPELFSSQNNFRNSTMSFSSAFSSKTNFKANIFNRQLNIFK